MELGEKLMSLTNYWFQNLACFYEIPATKKNKKQFYVQYLCNIRETKKIYSGQNFEYRRWQK